MKEYDAVIIGSGIGGLTAAGLLTARGLRTLLIEKEPTPGGYLASFRRNSYVFDAAVDCIAGATGDGVIRQVLEMLGVADGLEFSKVDPIRTSLFPDHAIEVAGALDAYADHLSGMFPHERAGIRSMIEQSQTIYTQLTSTVLSALSGDSRIGTISAGTIACLSRSYADFLADHVSDVQLKAVLADRCPFIGLPPSRVSAAAMLAMVMSYFSLGASRPKGGFQLLADRMVDGIRAHGGEVLFGMRAERILMNREGLCSGVRCENGEIHRADHVVSNADYVRTFRNLLGEPYAAIPDTLIETAGLSTSFFVVYAGIEGCVPEKSSIGYYPSYDMESFFSSAMELRKDSTIGVTIASVEDPSRAPRGCHTVVLHELVRREAQPLDKAECTDLVLAKAEKVIPGIRGMVRVVETATPRTFERYTDNSQGAAYGWQHVPQFRSSARHGIRNLHVAGHWGDFGGGVLGAAYSGARAASAIFSAKGLPRGF